MKLRSYLLCLLVAGLLQLVLFTLITTMVLSARERAAVEQGLQDTARALAVAVDQDVDNAVAVLNTLATSEALDAGDLRRFYDQATRVLGQHQDWGTITLIDKTRHQIINVATPFGTPLPRI